MRIFFEVSDLIKKKRLVWPSTFFEDSPLRITEGAGFAYIDGVGFADTNGEKSDGGLVSIQSASSKPKVKASPKPMVKSRMEGSCEARRIVDPSTMGSSLL